MKWQDLLVDGYGRALEMLERALEGLTRDELNKQPNPDSNSIGWITWHLTRVQDDHISDLVGAEQLWTGDKWYAKFNRAPDPKDIGFGHSSQEVAAFKSPDSKTLLEYFRAVVERTRRYIAALSLDDLDRKLDEPWFQPLPTVGVRLISVLDDNLEHVGQVAYLRGMFKGKGWFV